jgi:hypothetical protein
MCSLRARRVWTQLGLLQEQPVQQQQQSVQQGQYILQQKQ